MDLSLRLLSLVASAFNSTKLNISTFVDRYLCVAINYLLETSLSGLEIYVLN